MPLRFLGSSIFFLIAVFPGTSIAQTIHEAARDGDLAAVRRLIEEDPESVNTTDEQLRTPLHIVAGAGNSEVVTLLLDHGADPNLQTRDGLTALYLAVRSEQEEAVNLLLQRNVELELSATVSPTLAEAAARGAMELLFQRLVEAEVGLEDRVLHDGSLLHAAAEGGSVQIVRTLIDLGFDVAERDRYGWTPLHYAAEQGREQVSELLILSGADVNAASIGGHTPLSVTYTYTMEAEALLLQAHGAESPGTSLRRQGPWFGEELPGSEPKVFALDLVSSNRWEHGTVTFSPDGREAFWESVFFREDNGRILWSRWEEDGWSLPEYAPFSTEWAHGDDVPFFSPDGEKLYFLSQRPLEGVDDGGAERMWVVDRTGSGWGVPRLIDGGPNTMRLHWQFSAAANGNIYFGSVDPEGAGGTDIYVSRLVNGVYQPPQNLGPVINTDAYENSPFIAPDESYIIVTGTAGPDDRGGADLYISFKTPEGTWTPPRNLGETVNTPDYDMCPHVSGDGRFLFWNNYPPRPGNPDNFWMDAEIIEELRAEAYR